MPRLVHLLQAAETADRSGQPTSEAFVRLYLDVPHHTPDTDRWVVEDPQDDDKLVAHAALYLPAMEDDRRVADGMLVVHPAWRLKGLGTDLLARLEARVHASGVDTRLLRFYLDPSLEAAVTIAHAKGFAPFKADTYTEMRAVLNEVDAQPSLPKGFTLRSYREVDNLPTLVEALNRGYAGLHGHHQTTEEAFGPYLSELDWDGCFLLFAPDGQIAGLGGAKVDLDRTERNGVLTGRVDSPGLVPEHRSLALYEALLLAGVAYLRRSGAVRAELESWGDAPEVLALYQELGFVVLRQEVAYQRRIRGSEQLPLCMPL